MTTKNEVVRGQVDLPKIYERMKLAGGYVYDNELAAALGINPQALFNSKTRGSISLTLLVGAAEMLGVSLDYLVYGKAEGNANDDTYIDVDRIGGGKVRVLAQMIPRGRDIESLKAFVKENSLYIIDISDTDVSDGLYAFGRASLPVIRKCQAEVDGSILMEGKKEPQSAEELSAAGVVGKIIWHGSGC